MMKNAAMIILMIGSTSTNMSTIIIIATVHLHAHPKGKRQKLTGLALFGIGFVNMIIPCPTVAITYKYALDSASAWKATFFFGVYAFATAVSVGGVFFAIYRVARILENLSQVWVETALMRRAGVVAIVFASYSLYPYMS